MTEPEDAAPSGARRRGAEASRRAARPMVTAIMAARNAEGSIRASLEAVLQQSLQDFELIVVDDGSQDGTAAIVSSIADPRIRLMTLHPGVGRAAARNVGLKEASGELLAVCDADDISLPLRFEMQAKYLNNNREVQIVSAQLLAFDESSEPKQRVRYPATDEAIRARLFERRKMPIAHAASMFRRQWFESLGGYDEACLRAQDLELLMRGYSRGAVAVIDEPLVLYHSSASLAWRYFLENRTYARFAVRRALAAREGHPPPSLEAFLLEESSLERRLISIAKFAGLRLRNMVWQTRSLR